MMRHTAVGLKFLPEYGLASTAPDNKLRRGSDFQPKMTMLSGWAAAYRLAREI